MLENTASYSVVIGVVLRNFHTASHCSHVPSCIKMLSSFSLNNFVLAYYTSYCSLLKNIVVCFQAVECYKKALQLLSSKQGDDVVNGLKMSVSWDLSSVYFTMATCLQDFAPVSSYAQQQVLLLFD